MTTKLFRNGIFYSPYDEGKPKTGAALQKINVWPKGALLVKNGRVERIGSEREILKGLNPAEVDEEINLEGACVVPGFVDPHTHACFAARREAEFGLRLKGVPYLEILKQGGGILSSVEAVRKASEEELYETTLSNVYSALSFGTTTMEIKSGYGLDLENELKMLRVIERVRRETPLDVAITFMGGHAVPPEYKGNPDQYVSALEKQILPAVKAQGFAQFCDVFCEEGVFSVEQSKRILLAARELGFKLKIHADEVFDIGGAGLAAELQTTSAEHLLAASEDNLKAMAHSGVIGVVLPATAYSLKKPYAPVRRMIELGLAVALATDCNPGSCFCESMPFVFGLAVMNMDMTLEEALTGATLNAAYAIEMASKVGSLDPGKEADFLVLDGESPAILAYHAGVSSVVEVYKRGEAVV